MPNTSHFLTSPQGANTSERFLVDTSWSEDFSWKRILKCPSEIFSFPSVAIKMGEILYIEAPVGFDESVAHNEIHDHPYASPSFDNSDEI